MAVHDFRAQRLFIGTPLAPGTAIECAGQRANYLLNVLRLGNGDQILVFNGRDGEWRARIEGVKRQSCTLLVENLVRAQDSGPDLHYLFAPLKRARLDYMVQKATELGVAVLRPVITRRTVPERLNLERMGANVIEAAEQCGILRVPEVAEPEKLERVLAGWRPPRTLVFCDEGTTNDPLTTLSALAPGPLALLVGPEGGFAPEERELLLRQPFCTPLSLGPRIMRADTAAVAALALLNATLGDWRMPKLEIHQFPCRQDNYGVLIHDPAAGVTGSIDAPETAAVQRALAEKGWKLTHILTTHHHGDHTAGNLALKKETGCEIIGPKGEAAKIPGIDRQVAEGDTFAFGSHEVRVIDTPGHTAGHITYWIPSASVAFVGDTLFAMGCGRVIEGTHQTMWASLRKIMQLPPATRLYCGHEYTVANAKFALTIEPGNAELKRRAQESEELRAQNKPTLPTRVDLELATNPFLRAHLPEVRKAVGMPTEPDWQVFGEIRERKNRA